MKSPLLQNLYEELAELTERTNLIKALISSYGGTIPDDSVTPATLESKVLSDDDDEVYNFIYHNINSTWKEKIISVLEFHKKPMTTKEISQFLHRQLIKDAPDTDYIHVHSMITQIASAMGRAEEIGVDSSNFRNKYFIQPKHESA